MFKSLLPRGRQYWQLSLVVFTILIGFGLQAIHQRLAAHLLLALVSLGMIIPLLVDMWRDVREGNNTINLLAPIAIVTAVILHQYWVAITLAMAVFLTQTVAAYAIRRTRSELDSLLLAAPGIAHVMKGRQMIDVAASKVSRGDKIVIKPGEAVPVDAVILEGTSGFDESLLTGSDEPVEKTIGQTVVSGGVNMGDSVVAKALAAAANSQYEQTVRFVRAATGQPAPFVRMAQRFSLPFTVCALAIAGVAWYLGGHAIRFLEVLAVATPYPLLVAAPIAFIAGLSRAVGHGIIVRTGAMLERLANIKTLAFDKTGTLTVGKPAISKITAIAPHTEADILGMAATLQQDSTQLLARTVVQEATGRKLKLHRLKHVKQLPGHGLESHLHGKDVMVGQRKYMQDTGVSMPANLKSGKQAELCIAVDGKLAGVITFSEDLRPETKPALKRLRSLGITKMLLLTGDSSAAAEAIAQPLGVTEVRAETHPAERLHILDAISERPLAYLGDGINDSPLLTLADVGIALGAHSSTAASESADIIIMRDDIALVDQSVANAKRSIRIAKQAMLLGVGLSLILMFAFLTGRFSPLLGVGLQTIVNVAVIMFALRAHSGR